METPTAVYAAFGKHSPMIKKALDRVINELSHRKPLLVVEMTKDGEDADPGANADAILIDTRHSSCLARDVRILGREVEVV